MSWRGQRSRYDADDDWDRSDRINGTRRVNGDHSSSSTSMTRELDDVMRIIENDWNDVTRLNVLLPLFPSLLLLHYLWRNLVPCNFCSPMFSIRLWTQPCNSWIEARLDVTTTLSRSCTTELNASCKSS